MRVRQANAIFYDLTALYFAKAEIVFANQSRKAKTQIPLVTIMPGNVKRTTFSNDSLAGDINISDYNSHISYQVDLFTNGMPVYDKYGQIVAYENTAVDEMLAYIDFLNSNYTLDWCYKNDVSILVQNDVQDLTGILNDTNYEYRSRATILLYFVQTSVGYSAVFTEETTNNPVYEYDYETGDYRTKPSIINNSTGGGISELAKIETEYFEKVDDIKEEYNE